MMSSAPFCDFWTSIFYTFLRFSARVLTEKHKIFDYFKSFWFHRYAKYSSSRNQKRVVRGALLCPVLPFIYEVSALILQNCFLKSTFFRNFVRIRRISLNKGSLGI